MGKKYDPAQEEGYRKVTFELQKKSKQKRILYYYAIMLFREVLEAEKKGSTVEMKLAKITNEVKNT